MDINSIRKLLEYDPETGGLTRKTGRYIGCKAGWSDKDGYIELRLLGKKCKAHRIAWAIFHGSFPDGFLDHINGVTCDNRITNLREATQQVNQQNRRIAQRNNKSGFLGVSPCGEKFIAALQHNRKKIYLGTYQTAESAYFAYLSAKRIIHFGCTI